MTFCRKSDEFRLIFQFSEKCGSPTRLDPETKVRDQDIRSEFKPGSSGLQVPVSRGIIVQVQHAVGDIFAAFIIQNIIHLQQQI
jgi:hypothetical protein